VYLINEINPVIWLSSICAWYLKIFTLSLFRCAKTNLWWYYFDQRDNANVLLTHERAMLWVEGETRSFSMPARRFGLNVIKDTIWKAIKILYVW